MISIAEETAASPAQPTEGKHKAARKASRAPQGAKVAKKKGKSAKKATPAKKAHKGAKNAKSAREGSKTNQVLELLKRPGGVTVKELMKATGWQLFRSRWHLGVSKKVKARAVSDGAGLCLGVSALLLVVSDRQRRSSRPGSKIQMQRLGTTDLSLNRRDTTRRCANVDRLRTVG